MFRTDQFSHVFLLLGLLAGCVTHSELDAGEDQDGAVDADPADADTDDASDADDGDAQVPDPRHPIIPCGNSVYECADGLDNDGDGLIDSDDLDCFGPCDNNELGYYADHPGIIDGHTSCGIDCYFDDNHLSGSTDCLWDIKCDPLSPGEEWGGPSCSYDPDLAYFDCSSHFESQYEERTDCQDNCEFRIPNGCDCFGCCAFPTAAQSDRHVLIGSKVPGTIDQYGCKHEEAIKAESDLCAECTPVPSCYKECGRCELCLGKRTLPEDCTEEEAAGRCGAETQVCGLPGDEPCDEGFYCLSGCCVDFTSSGG